MKKAFLRPKKSEIKEMPHVKRAITVMIKNKALFPIIDRSHESWKM